MTAKEDIIYPLVHNPGFRFRSVTELEIIGYRDDPKIFPWGFWGAVLAVGALLLLVALKGSSGGFFSLWDILTVLVIGGTGFIFYRWGPKDTLKRETLAMIDSERKQLVWPVGSEDKPSPMDIILPFEEISEIVFAMIHFPVSPTRPDAHIHVFTLLVRNTEGRLMTIIEASPNKKEVFDIAKRISEFSNVAISQVGEGVLETK